MYAALKRKHFIKINDWNLFAACTRLWRVEATLNSALDPFAACTRLWRVVLATRCSSHKFAACTRLWSDVNQFLDELLKVCRVYAALKSLERTSRGFFLFAACTRLWSLDAQRAKNRSVFAACTRLWSVPVENDSVVEKFAACTRLWRISGAKTLVYVTFAACTRLWRNTLQCVAKKMKKNEKKYNDSQHKQTTIR